MASEVGSTPTTVEFCAPTHVDLDGRPIEPGAEILILKDPSEWVIRIQSCITKLAEDAALLSDLSPPVDAACIQDHNDLADRLDDIHSILASDQDDVDLQIRDQFIGIINDCGRIWANLYMNLSNVKKKAADKLELMATLQKRQQFTATSFERFMSQANKGKGRAEIGSSTNTQSAEPPGPQTSQAVTISWTPEQFVEALRPILETRKETARRPSMKAPESFDGTYSKLRDWWEKVRDYMEIHEPTMPSEGIKIKFVGYLLTEEARRWYNTRKRSLAAKDEVDTWKNFSKALVSRFTDRQEKQRDHAKLKALKYEGSIQDFLSQFEELNTRVGLTGQGLVDLLRRQITPKMGRAIYHRMGKIPDDDETLIEAIRECGMIEEEFARDKGSMKGSSQKKPTENKPAGGNHGSQVHGGKSGDKPKGKPTQGPGKPNTGKPDQSSPPQDNSKAASQKKPIKDFSQLPKLWDSYKEAYQGVPWEETSKHKDLERDCRRCGQNGHGVLNCRAGKTIGGTELPPHPGKKTSSANALKRKRAAKTAGDDSSEPPAQKEKTAAVAVRRPATSKPPIWALSDDEESDF